ncbi:MAG: trigger factor [Lachnospiraceae bacterium]|nr:trigger factor [Lachnospiraceae bacterium]
MKKRLVFAVLALTCLVFSGCSKSEAVVSGNEVSQVVNGVWENIKAEDYVELGQYKGLEVTRLSTIISDEDVEAELRDSVNSLLEAEEVKDRDTVENGDIVNIDFEGKVDGVAFEGGSSEDFDLTIGSGMFIEGFEKGLIGKKVGDKTELNLTFPEYYPNNESLQGKPVVFTVSVNSIKSLPELTDEAVKKVTSGEYGTIEEYKKVIKDELEKNAVEYADSAMYIDLWQQVVDNSKVKADIPTELLEMKKDTIKKNAEAYAKAYGMEWEDYLTNVMGITQKEFEEEAVGYAEEGAKESLVLMALAKAEGIEISQDELSKAMKEYVEKYEYGSVQEFMNSVNMDDFKEYILMSKVQEFLADEAVIKTEDSVE